MTPCEAASWNSRKVVASKARPGVEFVIARMTFGRRLELMRRVRDLAARLEYFEAGRDAKNDMEASLLGAEIDRLYIRWGLEEIRGLEARWRPGDAESLIESGPEELFFEALAAVKAECGLTRTKEKTDCRVPLRNEQQFANRAGWNCDSCRQHGLEVKRRCGFLPDEKRGEPRIVWGRKQTQTEECPKSSGYGRESGAGRGVLCAAAAGMIGIRLGERKHAKWTHF